MPLWFNSIVEMKLYVSFEFLNPNQPLVVGVSGGADSLCLLGMLHEAGFNLIVAHLNHQLRLEAVKEAEHVMKIAGTMGIPYVGDAMDVGVFATENGFSIEEAARKCRYRFLFGVARENKAQAVAVAHTADDQIETILMHLVRGAGLSGLKGMPPLTRLLEFDSEIPLARPILHLWRSDTEAYCRQNKLDFVLDASNADQNYFRNRLRHSLIPELETYNPRVKKAIFRMSRSLQDDYELLDALITNTWVDSVSEESDGFIAFDLPALEKISLGMRRNLLRRAMQNLRPGLRDVDYDVLELSARSIGDLDAMNASPSRKLDLTGGLYLYMEKDRLYIAKYETDLPFGDWIQIDGVKPITSSGAMDMGNGWHLIIDHVDGNEALELARINEDPFIAWMDVDKANGKLSMRPSMKGDAFHPFGMNGQTMKLSDFFINIKLPRRARSRWPVLLVDNEIAWVMGLRSAHAFGLEKETRQAMRMQLKRLP